MKRILFLLAILANSFFIYGQKIEGVILNDKMPLSGAEIFLIPDSLVTSNEMELIFKYEENNTKYQTWMILKYGLHKHKEAKEVKNELINNGYFTREQQHLFNDKVFTVINNLTDEYKHHSVKKTLTDGIGNYHYSNIGDGKYFLLVRYNEKIGIRRFIISNQQGKNISYQFE